MSDAALQDYKNAKNTQLAHNDSRRIRTKVADARNQGQDASVRWPFELLQNALDAGPLEGCTDVTVSLSWDQKQTTFEHTGAPFSTQELAALLSGGSSKEFESDQTTGRFGTGFLVTHVLAYQARVTGLLRVRDGLEQFELRLDRAGDEESIFRNIQQCDEAIKNAKPLSHLDGRPSARFEYLVDDQTAAEVGIKTFADVLPYLFASCPNLGQVKLQDPDGRVETWKPSSPNARNVQSAFVLERTLEVNDGRGSQPSAYRCIRISMNAEAESSVLMVLKQQGSQWACHIPEPTLPRIFCQFPLRNTDWLCLNVILEGRFEVPQERTTVHLTEKTKRLISDALRAVPIAAELAMTEGYTDAHRLARVGPIRNLALSTEYDRWWSPQLASVARQLSEMSLVETPDGLVCARKPEGNANGRGAGFPQPRLFSSDSSDETTIERFWPLVADAAGLHPPILPLVKDWSEISKGWADLKLDLNRVTLESLASHVRGKATRLTDLNLRSDPAKWLVRFIDNVGECWTVRKGVDARVLQGLLPNQKGDLCSPSDLWRDVGISEELKEIAEAIGIPIRARLLDNTVANLAVELALSHFADAITKAVPRQVSEEDLIRECHQLLEQKLEDGKRATKDDYPLIAGSIRLMGHLWESKGTKAVDIARKFPFVTLDDLIVLWTPQKLLMGPVSTWHETARPFFSAYPSHRVLAEIYCGDRIVEGAGVIAALVAWGIAIPDPLTKESPAELKDRRLAALADGGQDMQGVTVTGQEFSQISLLHVDVLNHCQNEEDARALLGLVLRYVAPSDSVNWKARRVVKGRRGGANVDINVRGALWLADLRSYPWVPVKDSEGNVRKEVANEGNLRRLLEATEPELLAGNDAAIDLLTECFGFDELDLRLLRASPDPAVRKRLRDGLAKLLETAGVDPATYESLARELEQRQGKAELVNQCRALGLNVQEAIGNALENHGLHVRLVDRGFDFEVIFETGDIADASLKFEVGRFLVEVKATRTGEARLTPLQAETAAAEQNRYILCVVDLRSVPTDRLAGPWTSSNVEPLARMVPGIGTHVAETWELVRWARAEQVAIRNDNALRYGIPCDLWEQGLSIVEWVVRVAADLGGAPPTESMG